MLLLLGSSSSSGSNSGSSSDSNDNISYVVDHTVKQTWQLVQSALMMTTTRGVITTQQSNNGDRNQLQQLNKRQQQQQLLYSYHKDFYNKVLNVLTTQYFRLLRAMRNNVNLCDADKLHSDLTVLVGVGQGLQQHMIQLLRIGGNEITRSICSLYVPDVTAIRAALLELRSYHYCYESNGDSGCGGSYLPISNSSFSSHPVIRTSSICSSSSIVTGGYYRVANQCSAITTTTGNSNVVHGEKGGIMQLVDRMALLLGRCGE